MSLNTELHQMHLNEWAIKFADQKASGLTVKQWCKENNLSIHKYNYWKHLIKQELASQFLPDIVPLTLTQEISSSTSNVLSNNSVINSTTCAIRSNTTSLSMNGISFELDSSISEEFLCTLIKAVRNA